MKAKALMTSIALAALTLTGCATNPYNTTDTRTRNSVMTGAALGAAIGALSQTDDGNRKDIGKAAAIGAVAGAGTGYAVTKIGQ